MPISVVVGGQFGSEGKGKVAHALATELNATIAIRVGGPNSGHTVIDARGRAIIFRHLPTAVLLPSVHCVLPAGSYIDEATLLEEIRISGVRADRLAINPHAVIITDKERLQESSWGLQNSIGSTGSGTGSAVISRILRTGAVVFAKDISSLAPFLCDTNNLVETSIGRGERVIVEGTQGFGLSLLHSNEFPFCTSRDTTAAAFISEAGLSPLDVDQIVLVIRSFPIRVGGNSGSLPNETDWPTISKMAGTSLPFQEFTSVTKKLRRVAHFTPEVVKRAITYNKPNLIVLNHIDHVDNACHASETLTSTAASYVRELEKSIGQKVDYVGTSPSKLLHRGPTIRRVGASSL